MIIESLNEYIEKVAGYIHDDDKLVTYKWLSKELEVHVNVAKQILWEFWQKHNAEENITSTVMLMGFLNDGGMRVEVVKESNLMKAKDKYSKIISEHIYSLQKALPDINLLTLAGEGDVKYSAIKCDKCVEHTEEELSALRWGSASKDHIQLNKSEAVKDLKQTEDKSKSSYKKVQQDTTEEKPPSIKKSPKSQQDGFSNFFTKSTQKNKNPSISSTSSENTKGAPSVNKEASTSETKKGSPTENKSGSPSKKKAILLNKKMTKTPIDSFFNKTVHKEEDTKIENIPSKNKESTSPNSKNLSAEHVMSQEPHESKRNTATKETKQKKNARGRKRDRSREEDTVKKRKRIVIDEDSSDTDPFNSDSEEPMNIPPSPDKGTAPKPKSPTPPPVKHEGGKRRILKLVDKTFQDEDGYLVTQKVHVYESCSEDEAETSKSKPMAKPDPGETKNKKKVQSTLKSFFKK